MRYQMNHPQLDDFGVRICRWKLLFHPVRSNIIVFFHGKIGLQKKKSVKIVTSLDRKSTVPSNVLCGVGQFQWHSTFLFFFVGEYLIPWNWVLYDEDHLQLPRERTWQLSNSFLIFNFVKIDECFSWDFPWFITKLHKDGVPLQVQFCMKQTAFFWKLPSFGRWLSGMGISSEHEPTKRALEMIITWPHEIVTGPSPWCYGGQSSKRVKLINKNFKIINFSVPILEPQDAFGSHLHSAKLR